MTPEEQEKYLRLMKKIQKANTHAFNLVKQLRAEYELYLAENATIPEGSLVDIFEKKTGNCIGQGYTGKVRRFLATDAFDITRYIENPENLKRDVSVLFYGVFGITNDGKPSKKHFFTGQWSLPVKPNQYCEHYIKLAE